MDNVSHQVLRLTTAEFNMLTPRLVDIYLQAMQYPNTMRAHCVGVWHRDSRNPGFTSVVALTRNSTGAAVLAGLAYGFYGYQEHWWYQQIHQELARSTGSPHLSSSLEDFFQISEVHVLPRYQQRGLGRHLLTALLDPVTAPLALLSTPEVPHEANNAFRLYRSLGFTDLLRNFTFSGDHRPFAVLSSPLPLATR